MQERKYFYKLSVLKHIEKEMQQHWNVMQLHQTRNFDVFNKSEKFFATFPYPYMNGRLHLGHALSLSKAEVYISISSFSIYIYIFIC